MVVSAGAFRESKCRRIGIDARILAYNNSGIARYARGLIRSLLLSFPAQLPGHELLLYRSWRASKTSREAALAGQAIQCALNVKSRRLFTPPHFIAESVTLPLELRGERLSLFHSLDFFSPAGRSSPAVLTLYDLHFVRDGKALAKGSLRHYRKLLKHAPHALHLIAISEATRRDAEELLNVSAHRISMVYPGYTALPEVCAQDTERVLESYQVKRPYMLAVGTVEPRKNLEKLFQAYGILAQKLKGDLPDLLVIGRKGYRGEQILRLLARPTNRGRVRYLGEVDDWKLACFYQRASVALYPSVYEGFGFPLLEAMAAGIPLVTSNCSSMPEVVRDAAQLVEPGSAESIACGIEKVLLDSALQAVLVRRGAARVKEFSWESCAEQIIGVYRALLGLQTIVDSIPEHARAAG